MPETPPCHCWWCRARIIPNEPEVFGESDDAPCPRCFMPADNPYEDDLPRYVLYEPKETTK